MADEKLFPSLPLKPDTYSVEWRLGDAQIAGEAELLGNRPPSGSVYGEPEGLQAPSRGFPKEIDIGLLFGRLRMGPDVVFGDTELSVWWPDRSMAFGRWALAGLGIGSLPEQRYSSMRIQVTGFETLFGWAPIKQTTSPKDPGSVEPQYSFTVQDEVESRWTDGNTEILAEYAQRTSIMNPYGFEAVFAPVMTLKSKGPLSVDEWVRDWAVPILRLTAFTSGRPQKMSWVTLHIDDAGEQGDESKTDRTRRRTAQLFGSGITQEPYTAKSPPFRTREAPLPLFTLATLGRSFVGFVEKWRGLETAASPFVELYGLVMFNPELPQRARFLYVIQALEALHSSEHQTEDQAEQQEYERLRSEAIRLLQEGNVDKDLLLRIKRAWPKRRPGSLPRRLHDLIGWVGQKTRAKLDKLATSETARRLAQGQQGSLEELLAKLRNELSHGGISIDDRDLRQWGDALDLVARTHLLRLLGFEQEEAREAIDRTLET